MFFILKKRIQGGVMAGLVAVIFAGFIIRIIFSETLYLFGLEQVISPSLSNLLYQISLLITALLFAAIFKPWAGRTFEFKKPDILHFGGSYLIFLSGDFLSSSVTKILEYFSPEMKESYDKLINAASTESFVINFILGAIFPAICEEFLFRGFILSSFSKINQTWLKAGLVGLIFAGFHLIPYQVLYAIPCGIALSYIMLKTKNLFFPIIFHFLNNAESTIRSYYYANYGSQPAAEKAPLKVFLVEIIFYCALAGFLFYAGRKVLNQKNDDGDNAKVQERLPI